MRALIAPLWSIISFTPREVAMRCREAVQGSWLTLQEPSA
jgi:hypothetical protein